MGDAGKITKISTDMREMDFYAEEQRRGRGKIEIDELGNAVWVPNTAAVSESMMLRLLEDPGLAITDDSRQAVNEPVKANPQGLKKGYDPYDSGMLAKKNFKKKKDLRRLSAWIKTHKPAED